MSLIPLRGQAGGADQRWQTIQFALGSWAKTARLCVIMLVMSVPVDVLAWLIHRH